MFADQADAMTMLGVKCLDEGVYNQAEFFFQVALEADNDYLSAKENLRVLFDRVVNRWHFRMLNDVQRNSTYFRAINRAVRSVPNCAVLDIGSGTGILRYRRVSHGVCTCVVCPAFRLAMMTVLLYACFWSSPYPTTHAPPNCLFCQLLLTCAKLYVPVVLHNFIEDYSFAFHLNILSW